MLAMIIEMGCAKPAILECAKVECPAAMMCDPNSDSCVYPEQLSECSGQVDDTPCMYTADTGDISGACTQGVCLPLGCGNGVLTPDEVCDDSNTTNGDGCSADCKSNETCGNGIVDPAKGEQCDHGPSNGVDGLCEVTCQLPRCGDGVVDNGEQCDAGSGNSEAPDAACRTNCTLPRCGDHVVDPSRHEVCDDGNAQSNDGCSADCLSDETCGNGVIDVLAGEVCDDGNTHDHDGCSHDCKSTEICGNKVIDLDLGEICDDGNNTNGDGCSSDCKSLEVCGDGEINTIHEECDNGSGSNSNAPNAPCRTDCTLQRCGDNVIDDAHGEACDDGSANSNTVKDACRKNCQLARCGDGVTDTGEVCDDGNGKSDDGCSADCQSTEFCGNSYIDVGKGEQCDDGNQADNDFCHHDCQIPRCGDGIQDVLFSEQCDDPAGNANAPDKCRLTCQLPRCGDHIVDTGEVCDDGNTTSGDGCSADCRSRETCGNGIVDPAKGELCDAGSGNSNAPNAPCRLNCKLPSCGDGVADSTLNEQCDAGSNNSNAPNAPCRPGCVLPHCGDHVIDTALGEVCDDGNLNAGDGCRPDCKSNETCGNGIVDVEVLEECDDANSRGRDGCSVCKSEDAVVLQPGQTPPARTQHVMAYDAGRQRVVMFGGVAIQQPNNQSKLVNDTWEWDGVSWTLMHPRHAPPPRGLATMAYDPVHHRTLLVGGSTSTGDRDDTWTWDGADWTQQATAPFTFSDGELAFDPVNNTMLLVTGNGALSWDGTSWSASASTPGTVLAAGMATDPIRKQVVLFVGDCCDGQFSNHTQTWNGTAWTDHPASGGTAGRNFQSIAFDATRGKVVLVGNVTNQTFEWDGNVWKPIAGAAPPARDFTAVAYDAARKQLVMFGGQLQNGGAPLQDTWLRSGTTWSQPAAWLEPPNRSQSGAAYDALRKRVVIFGGQTNNDFWDSQTWEWDGQRWTQGASFPLARRFPTLVYDQGTRSVVSFGGEEIDAARTTATLRQDLFGYDGTAWTKLANSDANRSPIRNSYVTYDIANDKIVTFGGRDDQNCCSNTSDTYTWTAAGGWSLTTPSTHADARRNHALAYDPVRKRTVMFAGVDDNRSPLRDVWEWNGTTWTNVTPANQSQSPGARFGFEMVYNPDAQRVLVFGNGPDVDDLWEWSGTAWTQRLLDTQLGAKYRGSVAYDAAHKQLMSFGGRDNQIGNNATTQLIQYRPFVTVEACTSADLDYDNDGAKGCADDDCWGICTPLCPPGTVCPANAPKCGDHVCSGVEDCNICPADCGVCLGGTCGDFHCDSGEAATCPSDCL